MRYGWTAVAACVVMAMSVVTVVRADEPDMSTPKKAAVAFAKAVVAGDMDAVKSLSVGTDQEYALVKSLSDLNSSLKKLEDAAIKKFGADAKLPDGMGMNMVSDMENADEKIDGDNATLTIKAKPDDKFPPTLKKDGDKWKVKLENLSKNPESAAMAPMMPKMIKALDTVTANIGADKYKTAVEVYTDLGQQLTAAFAPEPAK